MNLNRKCFVALLIICLSVVFSGCFPSAENIQNSSVSTLNSKNLTEKKHISKQLSDIKIDADVTYPKTATLSTYKVGMMDFNVNKLKDVFIKNNKNIKTTKETETDYKNYTAYIFNSKNENLGIYRDFFEYTTSDYDDISYFLSSQDYPVGFENMANVFKNKKLNKLDKEKSYNKVVEIVNKLNLPVSKTPETYAIDCKSLNKLSKSLNTEKEYKSMNMKYKYTNDDEAYMFVFHSKTNEVNHYDRIFSGFSDGVPTYSGTAYAVVNKKGLIMFSAYGMYNNQKVLSKDSKIINPDTVFNTINNKYKNIKANVTISNLKLYYFPVKKDSTSLSAELIPVWVAKVKEKVTEKSEKGNYIINNTDNYIVNAITGKVI